MQSVRLSIEVDFLRFDIQFIDSQLYFFESGFALFFFLLLRSLIKELCLVFEHVVVDDSEFFHPLRHPQPARDQRAL